MAMTQLPEVALTGNAENSTWTVNPTQLQGVGVAGNTFDNMTAFPSDQFVDGFAMASEGHSSFFSTTQMGYMRTPFAWNETATNQSVSVPSQLHYPPLVEGSSAAFAGAANANLNTIDLANLITRHRCHVIGCGKSFKRLTDLQRHIKSIHLKEEHWCHVAGCARAANGGKPFNRKDKRDEHVRKTHQNDGR